MKSQVNQGDLVVQQRKEARLEVPVLSMLAVLGFTGVRRGFILLAVLCSLGTLESQTVTFYETGEEFTGPFPSWKNVKTDYGAKGDGVTDDTPAIQAAINDLRNMPGNAWSTLYFPAGVYRLPKDAQQRAARPHRLAGLPNHR
jgi:hypothetical protein